jgi:hypothetical protein
MIAGVLVLLGVGYGNAQFKSQVEEQPRVSDGLIHQSVPSFLFGWLNPENFHMRHSFSFSYQTGGGKGLSLGTYTNSMLYQLADNLNARADISLSYSPYSSFSNLGKKDDLSSLYLSRAQVNYKPWDNVLMQFQYRNVPYSPYYYSPFYNPWYREDGF